MLKTCSEVFSAKWDLMKHRKNEHPETVAPCRNYSEGKCSYTDSMCWWNHNKEKEENTFKCYVCSQIFERRAQLMSHKKKEHNDIVRFCNQFRQNNCKFKDETCWFLHEVDDKIDDDENNADKNKNKASVFRKVLENLKPPINNQMEKNQNQK